MLEKKKFTITMDTMNTIWWRGIYEVEAESLEEAKKKILTDGHGLIESEYLYETVEELSPIENFALANVDILIPDDNKYDFTNYQTVEFDEI